MGFEIKTPSNYGLMACSRRFELLIPRLEQGKEVRTQLVRDDG